MNNRIELIDTTLRDGQQSPLLSDAKKYFFTLDDKLQILESLILLGVRYFELFSPIVSKKEEKDFKEIRKFIDEKYSERNIKLLAHVRCHNDDIVKAIDAGADGLNFYIGTSQESQKNNHGKTINQITDLVVPIISDVRSKHPHLHLRFSGEDAFRTKISDLLKVYGLLAKQVNLFGMPDTVGVATPTMVLEKIQFIKQRSPTKDLEIHFHNDRGLALINALTAITAGARFVDSSVWGLAERSGIPSTTALLLNLAKMDKSYVDGYDLKLCYPVNILMGSILRMHVPFTEPVSLTNRTHSAGVHQQAVLKNKNVYEAQDLESFGVERNEILLGPLSGWHLIAYYLREVENFELTDEQAKEITSEFKNSIKKMNKRNSPQKVLLTIVEKYPIARTNIPKEFENRRVENL